MMQTPSQKAASALILARRNATPCAVEAEESIWIMADTHANLYTVLSALYEKVERQSAANYSEVANLLDEALSAMDKVYAISPEERSEAVGNEMKESRDE